MKTVVLQRSCNGGDTNVGRRRTPTIIKLCVVTIALLLCTGCPDDDSSNSSQSPTTFQPSQAVQDGLQVFSAYSVYFDEYRRAQATSKNCNPFDPNCNSSCGTSTSPPNVNNVACQILNPAPPATAPPNPADPITLPTALLVFPGTGQATLPNELSTMMQDDFQALLKRVPAAHSKELQGWTLKLGPCSGGNQVLWSGHQANSGSAGGSICMSPLLVRAVFVDLAAAPSTNLFRLLVQHDSTNPFGFNGDSNALIRNYAYKEHINMTPDDVQAVSGVIDGGVKELGYSVLPEFKNCVDYLMAREVAQVYLPGQDENAVAAAAYSLVAPSNGTNIDVAPLSTTLLPSAIATNGATNWGVTKVGDAQQVLAGINSFIGNGR